MDTISRRFPSILELTYHNHIVQEACRVIQSVFKNLKLLERELQAWLLFWVNIGVPVNEIGGYWNRYLREAFLYQHMKNLTSA
jgi:hypothetical protein